MLSALGGDMLEVRDGYARGSLPLTEAVMQPTRVFHAGAITTLADEVASTAINGEGIAKGDLSGCLFPYSIQISVNLVSNDPVGPLVAEAQVVRRGRLTIVDTTVTGSTGNVVALMRSTHMMVDPSKVGPHLKKQPG
jgi:uncharacterized protein (TIGR00369 family)